jgi:EpsI family protein
MHALGLLGMTAHRSGDLIEFSGRLFEVIETCSGLRIIQTLIMTALVYGDLFDARPLRRIALVLLAPAIGFVVNGCRIVTIMLNPYSEVGSVHSTQGIVMIVVGVLLLAALDWIGSRILWRPSRAEERKESPKLRSTAAGGGQLRLSAVNLAVIALGLFSIAPLRADPPESDLWQLHRVPRSLGAWKSSSLELDQTFYGLVRFRDKFLRDYRRDGDVVRAFVGAEDRRRRDRSGYSPKTRLLGAGWEAFESDSIEIDSPPVTVDRLRLRKGREQQLAYHWRFGAGSVTSEALRWMLALDLKPGSAPGEIVIVRVSTELDGDEDAAARRLSSFLESFGPALLAAAPTRFQPEL